MSSLSNRLSRLNCIFALGRETTLRLVIIGSTDRNDAGIGELDNGDAGGDSDTDLGNVATGNGYNGDIDPDCDFSSDTRSYGIDVDANTLPSFGDTGDIGGDMVGDTSSDGIDIGSGTGDDSSFSDASFMGDMSVGDWPFVNMSLSIVSSTGDELDGDDSSMA